MSGSRLRAAATLCAAVGIGSPAVALAITIRDDRSDSQYLALGADAKYASVGAITWPGFSASGVLISPRWVLTAAHVVDTVATRTFFLNGSANNDAQHFANPLWTGNVNNGNDVGLMRLSTPITNVTPASLAFANVVGLVGTSVGFGLTGFGSNGYGGFSNLKRGCTNVIDATGDQIGTQSSVILSDFDNPNSTAASSFGSAVPTDLEGSIAPGDSGGGTFVDIGSRWYVAGIHSFDTTGLGSANDGNINASYSDVFGSSSVGSFLYWIDDNIGHSWIAGNGTFGNAASWSLGPSAIHEVPGVNDIVHLDSSATYTITLDGNTTNWQAIIRRGTPTVNLNGFTWNLVTNNFDGALIVGRTPSSEITQFAVNNGTLNTTETVVGFSGISVFTVGNNTTWNNSGDVYVGGDFLQQRSSGRLTISAGAAAAHVNIGGTLKVYSTGTVNYSGGSLSVATLDVSGGRVNVTAGANKVLRVSNLSVSGANGKIDLADNKMVVDYTGTSPLASVVSLINSGFAGGSWSGPGIVSSLGNGSVHGIGYAENATLGLSSFGGQSVDSSSVLVGYTFFGDANLDGMVDVTDLGSLATNWQTSAPWTGGDFNYDGFVDVTDLGELATNWQAGVAAAALGMSFDQALAAVGLGDASVPEPATLTLLAAGFCTAASRRRRRR